MTVGDPDRNLKIYQKMIADGKFWNHGSNIIMDGSYIITNNMKRLFLYWSSFCSQWTDG